ncbi:MAG: vitamin B12-dependent ribonucleotide reductase [bacterium]
MSKLTKVGLSTKARKAVKTRNVVRRRSKSTRSGGLKISRFFTERGKDPLETLTYEKRDCKIVNPDGSVVFEMSDVEVPKSWSKVASDILISKYLRKNGVPQTDKFGNVIKDKEGNAKIGPEKSAKQVFKRIAGCWRYWAQKHKYFASSQDAQNFEDEMLFMLANQYGAPNSPQWFNTGLNFAYGITGPAQGHWYADPKTGRLKQSEDAYSHPQPHACFIQSVKDDLVNKGGIFDLITREARIFKYGSGSGSNFSDIRANGESLSGGGNSTGLMSWLEIFDKAAGAIKSGGTTRRAAKMVVLNIDHPEVEEFINWKHREEEKAAALIAEGYSAGLEGDAYQTISGQNSNNTIRVDDEYMRAVEDDKDWHLRWRTDRERIAKTVKAKELWDSIAKSTWHCGDPGLQFDTTVNDWHTCLASGRINASNPCSEFMFLDDSSCNLASLNLVKFVSKKGELDIEAFTHATRLWTVVLEISVLMAQFPSYEIAKNSYLFRPLGLGYANLGALLMVKGLAYDSDQGKGFAAGVTSLMTGISYATSAEMAKASEPFAKYEENKDDMMRVIRNHRRASNDAPDEEFESLAILPYKLKREFVDEKILEASKESWDRALLEGGQFGFRNAQVTLLAPTGTIGLLMDCDTTGIEPDYALVKFKKLAGGGYFKIINQSVPQSLRNLKYSDEQIDEIITHIVGSGSLENSPHINRPTLIKKGLSDEEIDGIEKSLKGAFDISQAFTREKLTDEAYEKLGISTKDKKEGFDLLGALGFSKDQIDEASEFICGSMTIEGSQALKDSDLLIFDCANRCGVKGKRFIAPEGHIKMMAAVQPFLSGAISKTVNMPGEATVEDIEKIYMDAWKLGLKAIAIYRDGSKLAQPLNSKKDASAKEKEKVVEKEIVIEYRPVRKRLAKQRTSITRKVVIGGHKMFLTVGLYEDNRPGELFIIMNQQGSFAAGMADSFAKMVSVGLQYGVPIETMVSQLRHMRFQPMGFTGDADISNASSLPDFIAQWFENMFLSEGLTAMKLPFTGDKIADKEDEKAQSKLAEKVAKQVDSEDVKSTPSLFNDAMGFSGEMCSECGLATMVQNGHCLKCVNCGATTGCS